jgi:hypothetical protein
VSRLRFAVAQDGSFLDLTYVAQYYGHTLACQHDDILKVCRTGKPAKAANRILLLGVFNIATAKLVLLSATRCTTSWTVIP